MKYILGKRTAPPVDLEAKERSRWCTIEAEPARYIWGIGNQQPDLEIKVRNFVEVSLQHSAITQYPDLLTVVGYFIMDEFFQIRPLRSWPPMEIQLKRASRADSLPYRMLKKRSTGA